MKSESEKERAAYGTYCTKNSHTLNAEKRKPHPARAVRAAPSWAGCISICVKSVTMVRHFDGFARLGSVRRLETRFGAAHNLQFRDGVVQFCAVAEIVERVSYFAMRSEVCLHVAFTLPLRAPLLCLHAERNEFLLAPSLCLYARLHFAFTRAFTLPSR